MSQFKIRIEGLHKVEFPVITPNTTLQEALESFCEKHALDASEYVLISKHKKSLDPTLPFRLTGLTPNAHLEIMKIDELPSSIRRHIILPKKGARSAKSTSASSSNSTITSKKSSKSSSCIIGIQMPTSERYRLECAVSDSLWKVLRSLELQENINVTRATDANTYFMPQLSSMRAEYKTWEDMRTTLRKVGLKRGDNALLRLTFVPAGEFSEAQRHLKELDESIAGDAQSSTEEDSMDDASSIAGSVEAPREEPVSIVTMNATAIVTTSEESATTAEEDNMDISEDNSPHPDDVVIPVENLAAKEVKLFRMGTGRSASLDDISHEDFELKGNELRAMMAEITKRQKQRDLLLTSKHRDQEQEKKKRRYDQALIRVRFPQGYILQGTFKPGHKLKRVHQMIQAVLQDPQVPFYLFTAPPVRKYENPEATLEQLNMVPASILNVSTKQGSLMLREDMIERYCQNLTDQLIPQNQNREETSTRDTSSGALNSTGSQSTGTGDRATGGAKAMPKWFKMGFAKK